MALVNVSGGGAVPVEPEKRKPGVVLEAMTVPDLLVLRAQVDALLPVRKLKDVNLETELVLQVQALQALQNAVIQDEDTPANQRSQCASALSSALVNLVKLQNDLYTSERLKKIEAALITCLGELPMESQEGFLVAYETAISQGG